MIFLTFTWYQELNQLFSSISTIAIKTAAAAVAITAETDFLPRGLQSSNNSLRWICKRMQLIFHFLAASAQFNCQLPFNGLIGLQQLQQQQEDLQELIVGRR